MISEIMFEGHEENKLRVNERAKKKKKDKFTSGKIYMHMQ